MKESRVSIMRELRGVREKENGSCFLLEAAAADSEKAERGRGYI